MAPRFRSRQRCSRARHRRRNHIGYGGYFNTNFTVYGKNGTAAGISNAASSLGVVVCSYAIVKIAEVSSWHTVKIVWLATLVLSVLVILIALPMSNRFKRLTKSDESKK